MQLAAPLPDMMPIEDRDEAVQLADHDAIAPAAGIMMKRSYRTIRVMIKF
jgi:hypothetical protein